MNPASPSDPTGDGFSPEPPQPSPDWEDQLREAIEKRDGARAIQLAERYVHRYGMHTLESLLARLHGGDGDEEQIRSWLLPLLSHPTLQPSPSLPPPPPPVSSGHPGLDEVFAPLEIAFPPLTIGYGQIQAVDSSVQSDPEPSAPIQTSSDDPDPLNGPVLTMPMAEIPLEDGPFLNADGDQGEAAPVPTFSVDGLSGGQRSTPRRSRTDDRRSTPAPISPALERWIVWLPGAVQSRSRS